MILSGHQSNAAILQHCLDWSELFQHQSFTFSPASGGNMVHYNFFYSILTPPKNLNPTTPLKGTNEAQINYPLALQIMMSSKKRRADCGRNIYFVLVHRTQQSLPTAGSQFSFPISTSLQYNAPCLIINTNIILCRQKAFRRLPLRFLRIQWL